MRKLLIGLLCAFVAASRLTAATNLVAGATNPPPVAAPDANDPVEKEYKKLMEDDDAAQAEVDEWIKENEQAAAKGGGVPPADLKRRIRARFEPIGKAYVDFLARHPDHARARVAYGSFLGDLQDEDGAREQWEKALALNAKDPAVYNNLANLYGHTGPVKKAFEYYAKAIELNPQEPIYYDNFGTTVFLFRKDAIEYYHITEQQVYDKALELYSKALRLDPTNFPLASEVAQTYYGIKPLRTNDALVAWTNTLAIAHDEIEREGVYLHLARIKLIVERFTEARAHLAGVTNSMYDVLKKRLVHNLDEQEIKAGITSALNLATERSREETHAHVNVVTNDIYDMLKKRLTRNLDKQEPQAQGTNAAPRGASVPIATVAPNTVSDSDDTSRLLPPEMGYDPDKETPPAQDLPEYGITKEQVLRIRQWMADGLPRYWKGENMFPQFNDEEWLRYRGLFKKDLAERNRMNPPPPRGY